MTRARIRAAWTVLLLAGALRCSHDVDTQIRTLPSGRRVEVFRIFPQEGPRGTMLNYFYYSPHFGDQAAFDEESAAVLLDAQREAEEHKAQELILIAGVKNEGLLALVTGSKSHSWLYRRTGNEWRKVRED